jgi:hypothetical protein
MQIIEDRETGAEIIVVDDLDGYPGGRLGSGIVIIEDTGDERLNLEMGRRLAMDDRDSTI